MKDPYIREFLNLKQNKAYYEKDLEQGLLDNLQEFLSENDRLFASKYMLYLPTEEELKEELQRERRRLEDSLEEK